MAHEESLGIAGLRLETEYSQQLSGFTAQDDLPQDDVGEDRTRSDPSEMAHSKQPKKTKRSNNTLNELHTSTPPITVPYPDDSHLAPYVEEEIECPQHPRYAEPSPLEQFVRNRQPSISMDSEMTLDSDSYQVGEDPLRQRDSNNEVDARPTRPTAELRDDAPLGYLGRPENEQALSESQKHENTGNTISAMSNRQIGFSPIAETFSVPTELEQPTSLTSQTTASALTDELRTPPETHKGPLYSPFSGSPQVQHVGSLDDPSGWSNVGYPSFGAKPRSYTFGRDPSLRYPTRKASRRSTNSSGKSPASNFLSFWSRDEVASLPDDEGQVVGTEYVIGKQIGFGGFSTVKEAFKVTGDGEPERFAVKIVRTHLAGKSERENEQVQAEFDHEVRIWRYLNHPNVLPLKAVYETDYATFCFTKMTTGGTLFDLVRKNRRGVGVFRGRHYAHQLAAALRYLHEDAHVVHRDIKLENCLLDFSVSNDADCVSRLILCDFGMAEWIRTDNGGNSPDAYDDAADRAPPKNIGPSDTSTSVAGSLEYASPELLLASEGVLDPIVDIWAFGVVVFSLLVGIRPFQHPFQPRIRTNILDGSWDKSAILRLEADPQDCQDALDLIQGCLEMDTTKRWTISEVMSARWFRCFAGNSPDSLKERQWKF